MDNIDETRVTSFDSFTAETYLDSRKKLLQMAEIDPAEIKSIQDLSSSYSGLGESLFKATVSVGSLKTNNAKYPNEEAEMRIQDANEAFADNDHDIRKLKNVHLWYERLEKELENNQWVYSVDSDDGTYKVIVDNKETVKLIKQKGEGQEFIIHLPISKQIAEPLSQASVVVDQTPVDTISQSMQAASVIHEFLNAFAPTLPDYQQLNF